MFHFPAAMSESSGLVTFKFDLKQKILCRIYESSFPNPAHIPIDKYSSGCKEDKKSFLGRLEIECMVAAPGQYTVYTVIRSIISPSALLCRARTVTWNQYTGPVSPTLQFAVPSQVNVPPLFIHNVHPGHAPRSSCNQTTIQNAKYFTIPSFIINGIKEITL